MQGVLKPTPPRRDGYSQVTNLQHPGYYNTSLYSQPVQAQQSQQNPWPSSVETPYYPSTGAYGSPPAPYGNQYNNSAYATPEQPSSTPHATQYPDYDTNSNTNTYTYPDPESSQANGYTQPPAAEASEESASPAPDSAQKADLPTHETIHQNAVHDLDELMAILQADIDACFVNGVHECCKTELWLGGNAFVPLMRPNIGPYADGGDQDLPADFKTNYPDDIAKEKSSGLPQTEPQNPAQESEDATTAGDGERPSSTQREPPASTPQQPPATTNTIPEPEDPLKRCPNATVSCVLGITDREVRSIVQRAASRGMVQRISNLDGFKYMFNNFWTSHADGEGLRYSFTCRDSLQNKDRFAHVPARPTTAAKNTRGPVPRRTKESWDCKGSLSVKFSQSVGAIIVQYRHAAVHPTHAARKRPPRKPAAPKATRGPGRPKGTVGTKMKRDSEVGGVASIIQSPLSSVGPYAPPVAREPSLFELLQQSAIEAAANEDGGQLGDASRPWWSST